MIRDYLLLLSWLCAVQGKIGKYPDGNVWMRVLYPRHSKPFFKGRVVRVTSLLESSPAELLKRVQTFQKFVARRFFERCVRKKKKKFIRRNFTFNHVSRN